MDTTDRLAKPDKALEPARGWRNWYLALRDTVLLDVERRAGEEFHGPGVYASKDLAETAAQEKWFFFRMASDLSGEPIPVEYIGAREIDDDA